ncbi:MAG: hypothetical protein IKU34_04125 [Clostridia bacterium]|nr:hypothetical protein [Clostridia bacterium]
MDVLSDFFGFGAREFCLASLSDGIINSLMPKQPFQSPPADKAVYSSFIHFLVFLSLSSPVTHKNAADTLKHQRHSPCKLRLFNPLADTTDTSI